MAILKMLPRSASLLEDFCDGQAYKLNVFVQSNTSALQ